MATKEPLQSLLAVHAQGKNKSVRCVAPIQTKSNQVIRQELTVHSLGEGRDERILVLVRDISDSTARSETTPGKAVLAHHDQGHLLESVVGNAPLVLFSVDRNGLFTLSEGNGLKALNLKPGEVVGQSAFDFYRENPKIILCLRRALAGENFVESVVEKGRIFETRYSPILDEKGEVSGIIGTAMDVTDLKQASEALQRRVDFEKIISTLSPHFINLSPQQVNEGIQNAMKTIGEFIGADRILIFNHQQGRLSGPEFEWHAGENPMKADRLDLVLADYPWFHEKVKKKDVVSISSSEEIPEQAAAEKRLLLSRGVRSFVAAPMICAGNLVGLLMISNLQTQKRWTCDDLSLFKIAGEMFANSLEHRKSEETLRGNEEKFRELFNNAIDAIFLHEISEDGIPGKFLEVNDIACSRLGFPREELLRMTPFDITLPEDLNDISRSFKRLIQQGHLTFEKVYVSKNGGRIPVEVNSHLFFWNNKKVVQSIARDITDRKRAEETIRRQAYYDILTNLPNRALFKDRLEQAMKHAHRNNQRLGVVVLDLDRFKNINETLGHLLGDKLLVAVAERLLGVLNESETIARFGGDEFTLLLPQVTSVEEAAQHAQKIIELLGAPFKLNSHELHVTTSIGMAFYPDDGENSEILLKNAETAMYRAKEQGRNNCQLYASVMNATAFKQLLMENSLQRALEREEFVIYYQPQIDIKTRALIGTEALVRWQHPDLGLVYPSEFIGLAEETGLIVPIGEWIIRQVCLQSKKWQEEGYPKVCVSVNLSARQFQQQNLVSTISQNPQGNGHGPSLPGTGNHGVHRHEKRRLHNSVPQ